MSGTVWADEILLQKVTLKPADDTVRYSDENAVIRESAYDDNVLKFGSLIRTTPPMRISFSGVFGER